MSRLSRRAFRYDRRTHDHLHRRNTTARQQEIKYTDAQGTVPYREEAGVRALRRHSAGSAGTRTEAGRGAGRGQGDDPRGGRTQLTWNLVLYPPLGDYTEGDATHRRYLSGPPEVRMEVVPVVGEDPSVSFSTGLLDKTLEGNTSLAQGLGVSTVDLKLARGVPR